MEDARLDLHKSQEELTSAIIDLAHEFNHDINDFALMDEPRVVVKSGRIFRRSPYRSRQRVNFLVQNTGYQRLKTSYRV